MKSNSALIRKEKVMIDRLVDLILKEKSVLAYDMLEYIMENDKNEFKRTHAYAALCALNDRGKLAFLNEIEG